MSTISKITRTILFTTLLAASACSSNDSEKSSEKAFPASSSKDRAPNYTAVVPTYEPMAQPTPLAEDVDKTPAATVPLMPEPTTFAGWMQRGRERLTSGENSGALADYAMAVEQRPQSQRARIQLARTFLAMDEAGKAREHAEAALEIDGGSSLAWNTMGRIELIEGENEAAIASFQRATEEDADNSYAWNNLGFVLIEEGLYEEAVAALEEATSGGTPKAYMWNNLGMAYEHQDQIELARAAYRQAGNGGSAKALANFDRLEGVVSLVASDVEIDSESPVEVAEVLEVPEESSEPVVETEFAPAEAVEVAEVMEP